jgi:hypothetical protein
MQMDRRSLLALLGSLGLGTLVPRGRASGQTAGVTAGPGARGLFLMVDGIGPAIPAEPLRQWLEPFAARATPVALGLRPGPDGFGPELLSLLSGAMTAFPALFEPVLRVDTLAGLPPYAQMRAAARELAALERALAPGGPLPFILSLATDAPAGPASFDALRALGLRSVLLLGPLQRGASSILPCDGAAMCLQGSAPLGADAAAADLAARLADPQAGGAPLLAVIDAAALTALPLPELRDRAEALSGAMMQAVQSGVAFAVPPRAHLGWAPPQAGRRIALRLDAPGPGDLAGEAGFRALAEALAAQGWPVSQTRSAAAATGPQDVLRLGGAVAGMAEWATARAETGAQPCAVGTPGADAAELAAAGLSVVVGPKVAGQPVLDDHGLIHRAEIRDAALLATSPPGADLILALGPDSYRDAAPRAATLAQIAAAASDGRTLVQDLAAWARDIQPADPVLAILRATRRTLRRPEPPADASAPDAAALLDDARHAWLAINSTTVAQTGLCPATMHIQPDGTSTYRTLTMWECGSLLRAVLAAGELGLIDGPVMTDRIDRILSVLPVARIGDQRLPSELISTDTGQPMSPDFNVFDTGRLLSALAEVDAHPATAGKAAPVVARWDLAGTATDGRLRSFQRGRPLEAFVSQATHYVARAFGAWGVPATSPYVVAPDGSEMDRQMRLLTAVTALGAYGAEPLLLEILEMGASDPAAVLADVLHAAQRRAHAATGVYHAVSEGPLDTPPWFAYDGLRLNDAATRWESRANSPNPAYSTPEALEATLRISTKAAFLWWALRPGAYTGGLLAHVRARTRVEGGGFSTGIYMATGNPMPGYTDVNTNAIVLDAIAHVLRGRRRRDGAPVFPQPVAA